MEEAVLQLGKLSSMHNFQLLILIYSCDLLMIIGLAASWSAWPVPPFL